MGGDGDGDGDAVVAAGCVDATAGADDGDALDVAECSVTFSKGAGAGDEVAAGRLDEDAVATDGRAVVEECGTPAETVCVDDTPAAASRSSRPTKIVYGAAIPFQAARSR